MNAARKLKVLSAIGEFSSYGVLTARGMTAFAGDHHSFEKNILNLFPKFSWNAKQAIQLALVSASEDRSKTERKLALLEVAKAIGSLSPAEMLVLGVAMEHGVDGLHSIQPLIKLIGVKK